MVHGGASGVTGNMSTWVGVIIMFTSQQGFSNSAILIFKPNNHLFRGVPGLMEFGFICIFGGGTGEDCRVSQ